jgi:hypothetical protein
MKDCKTEELKKMQEWDGVKSEKLQESKMQECNF